MEKNLLLGAQQKVFDLVKSNQEFFEYCYQNWDFGYFTTQSSTTGVEAELRKQYFHTNPKLADDLMVIFRAINTRVLHHSRWEMNMFESVQFLQKLHGEYASRIRKEARKPTNQPYRPKTPVIWELMNRGFIDIEDLEGDNGDYMIVALTLGLAYKKTFVASSLAKDIYRRFAIKPICTILPYKRRKK